MAKAPKTDERDRRRRRLGEAIRSMRTQVELTQGELGELLVDTLIGEFPQTTVSRWETGAVEVAPEQVYAIEEVLKLTHGTLFAAAGYGSPGASVTTEEAIMMDPALDHAHKEVLLSNYRVFVENARENRDLAKRFERQQPRKRVTDIR